MGGRGNASKNIDIQNFINSKPPPSSSSKSKLVNAGPNISLKRKSSPLKPTGNCLDKKRFKSSAIEITPSAGKEAPTIIRDERRKTEEEPPTEDLSSSYDNCTHGDPMGYLCLDCIYLRWKTAYDFVKTRKEKKGSHRRERRDNSFFILYICAQTFCSYNKCQIGNL